MWIKIKSDLYNLENFHTISKNKFKIEVWCPDELLNIHFDTQEECDREFERIEQILLEGK